MSRLNSISAWEEIGAIRAIPKMVCAKANFINEPDIRSKECSTSSDLNEGQGKLALARLCRHEYFCRSSDRIIYESQLKEREARPT